ENSKTSRIKLIKILRKYQPEMAILPFWEGRHPDHYKTSILGYESCFLSGLEKLNIPGHAYRPKKIIYYISFNEITPSFIVDITNQFSKKLELVKCYKSQFTDSKKGNGIFLPSDEIFNLLEARARICGASIGKKYGEAFLIKQPMEIEDIVKIKGKFI
ncbi:bacillithiol biosynthesis deacetylase BshB1, partial [Candidatus Poribacteria bacterium]|nr:bacillithiol biosynthesis deacetylase BshB1 [Candidatus Poribacteria bacterium]